ncbi:hypothetical protein PG997_010799 [Apiospora hydei]|uniref:Uncharacterized protein n=1 Tax=Apiospora hydei TaxID=1337664 RepID=A0ABR1VJX5_9PEZI
MRTPVKLCQVGMLLEVNRYLLRLVVHFFVAVVVLFILVEVIFRQWCELLKTILFVPSNRLERSAPTAWLMRREVLALELPDEVGELEALVQQRGGFALEAEELGS